MSLEEACTSADENNVSWRTSTEYQQSGLKVTASKFFEIINLLIERPNLHSTHLFRADVQYDSSGILQTILEKEHSHDISQSQHTRGNAETYTCDIAAPLFENFDLNRTVVRRLIPRNPERDHPMDQACFLFSSKAGSGNNPPKHLVVYKPHDKSLNSLPWYHPQVQALAYLFEEDGDDSCISIHYKPLPNTPQDPLPRLHRTMLSLIQTFVRLTKLDSPPKEPTQQGSGSVSMRSTVPSSIKDTILPQHLVQDTYTRLKRTYASDLMERWVEKTEPSKHVFEDLSIAAFLVELWRQMYDVDAFPGFVDLACGNGVLVYILTKEGYHGYGYDARHRKTWQILDLKDKLEERLCIPKLFLDSGASTENLTSINVHDGVFPPGTFIISNHADELTTWTPILAYLSSPTSPLPFLAIPCCSHALSGARHRYNVRDIDVVSTIRAGNNMSRDEQLNDSQSASGDLRALRKQKQKAAEHGSETSQYACLTKKVVALAEELGIETEMTLLRIPSTRNIGIVGNRKKAASSTTAQKDGALPSALLDQSDRHGTVEDMLKRECQRDGGVQVAANIWIERARKLQGGGDRGKVNLGGKPSIASESKGT